MRTHSRLKSPHLPTPGDARARDLQSPTRSGVLRLAGWTLGGLAATTFAFLLGHAMSVDKELNHALEAFRHRVVGSTSAATVDSAAAALARRYLQTLDPAVRQRISDQVRGEQRAGLTPNGNRAFVMRRLELYEAALQRTRGVPVSPGTLSERGE